MDTLFALDQLRLQKQKLVVADFEFQVLAHEVAEIGANFDLHGFRNGSNCNIINKQVLFQRGLIVVCFLVSFLLLFGHLLLKLLVH